MYELNVDARVQGTQQLDQLAAATEKQENRTKRVADAIQEYIAKNEKLSGVQAKLALDEVKLEQLREKHRMQLEGLSAATTKTAAAQDRMNDATRRSITDVQAASAAIRGFEGNLPIRAVEQFAVKMLGLGPALQAIFPVIGAVAFVGVLERMVSKLGELYNAWNPVLRAQTQSLDLLEKSNRAFEGLVSKQNSSRLDAYERQHGQRARLLLEANEATQSAGYMSTSAGSVGHIQDLIAQQKAIISSGQVPGRTVTRTMGHGESSEVFIPGFETREASAARVKLGTFQAQLEEAQKAQDTEMQRAADLRAKAAKISADAAEEEVNQSARALAAMRKAGQTPTAALLERYMALRPSDRAAGVDFMRGQLPRTANQEFMTYVDRQLRGGEGTGYEGAFHPDGRAPHKLTLTGFDDSEEANEQYRNMKEAVRTYDAAEVGRVNTQSGTIREQATRRSRLIGAGGSAGDELSTLRQQMAVRAEAARQELALKEAHKDILDIDKARLEYVREIGDMDLDYQIKILELIKQQRDEFTRNGVGFIHAAAGGKLGSWVKGRLESLGDKGLEQIFGAIFGSLKNTAGGKTVSIPDVLGSAAKDSPENQNTDATKDNTDATRDLTDAMRNVFLSSMGPGSGGGSTGSGGILYGLPSDGSSGGGPGGYGTGLPGGGGGGGASGAALAAGGAGLLISGIRRGGAAGGLQAAGGAAIAAAGILPMISKALKVAGPIGEAVGAGLEIASMIAGLFGTSRESRAGDISHTLMTSQYMAPVSINASMTAGGAYADYDRFGGVRSSSLSPFPSVEQGFFDYRRNVTVPGRTVSNFGGGAAPVTVHVQTMDSKSFLDNAHHIGDAVQRALAIGHTGLQSEIRGLS